MTSGVARKIETLLCAHDFSETADLALEQAVRFARRHDARIVLTHVIEALSSSPYPVLAAPENEVPIRDLVMARLQEVAAPLLESGLGVELRVELGLPGPALVEAAEAEEVDVLVIGTRGLSGVARLMMGSTAEHIVRRCPCPVLTVHPEDAVLGDRLTKVLVPTDLSGNATAAADAFRVLFGGVEQPSVIFAYADETPPYFAPFKHETLARARAHDQIRGVIEDKMVPTVEALRASGFEVETRVLDGNPVATMTALALREKVDLVLLSTRGRGALINTLLGRTAQRIVQHAPCPVLSVRP